ncbi:MAG: hypothetical protein N2204_09350 [Anaerolineae bacterium]|nr:hypothetical protein [Anaerolineae bacterium]
MPPDARPALASSYVVNGVDPTGAEYSGVLSIEPDGMPDRYRLRWTVTGSLQEGEGVLAGNTLRVEWRTVTGPSVQAQGLVTYTVTTAGELYGPRTITGYPGQGHETAFPK